MRPRTKLQLSLYIIIGILAFGTLGYKVLAGWDWFESFYFTLITITTIGFGEPAGMTEGTRYFTVILVIMGVTTLGYALSASAQAVIEFELVARFGKRRMFKDINKITGHYILCGSGRMGSRVIREMSKRGAEFIIIETNEAVAEQMMTEGHLVLMGDATNEDVLRAAGIDRARGLVCAVTSDPDNLYITLTARDLNKDLLIVARANDEAGVNRLLKAGANKVVAPVITGSHQMAQMLLRPAVADFIELATMTDQLELEIEQIEIRPLSPFVGRPLKESGIRSEMDVIIIAIRRAMGEMLFNPSADTLIQEGDALVSIGSHSNLELLERMANPGQSAGIHRHVSSPQT